VRPEAEEEATTASTGPVPAVGLGLVFYFSYFDDIMFVCLYFDDIMLFVF